MIHCSPKRRVILLLFYYIPSFASITRNWYEFVWAISEQVPQSHAIFWSLWKCPGTSLPYRNFFHVHPMCKLHCQSIQNLAHGFQCLEIASHVTSYLLSNVTSLMCASQWRFVSIADDQDHFISRFQQKKPQYYKSLQISLHYDCPLFLSHCEVVTQIFSHIQWAMTLYKLKWPTVSFLRS